MSASKINVPQGALVTANASILISATTSDVISTSGMSLVGVSVPTGFTGTAISFTVSDAADGTFVALKSTTSGTALSYTVAAATYAAIDPKDFYGVKFFKIVSGSTEAAARTLVCSLKGI